MNDADGTHVAEQFESAAQQRRAAQLGIWTFLTTEVMFFGGLFLAYTVYRVQFPAAFEQASRKLYMWIGVGNTAVLLLSSYTMALAVHAHSERRRRAAGQLLLTTAALGGLFLIIKALEYYLDYRAHTIPRLAFEPVDWRDPRHTELFFVLYFFMTGLHALHVIAGLVVVMFTAAAVRFDTAAARRNLVESVGLYWHFVDIIWLFLLPLLYLVGVR